MHNGLGFDYFILRKFYPHIPIDRRKIFDTLVAARLADPEANGHSLEEWGKRLGEYKGDYKGPWDKWTQEMEDYCVQDVVVGEKLYDWCLKRLGGWGQSVRIEHDAAFCIQLQMQNGFRLDVEAAQRLLADLVTERDGVVDKLKEAFPPIWISKGEVEAKANNRKTGLTKGAVYTKIVLQPFNPGSGHQIADRLKRKYGWKPKKFTPSGEPATDEDVIKQLPYPEAKLLAEFARLDKMLKQLNAKPKKDGSGGGWLHHERDGRVYGYVNSNGAVTGRMTHSKPNMANVDKDERMRSLWKPREGWVLVGCDAEGLELRMLAHYLAAYDCGRYATAVVSGNKADESDPHSLTKKAVKLFDRDNAKRVVYALIYGAGDPKLGAIVVDDAIQAGKLNPQDAPHLFNAKGKRLSYKLIGANARLLVEKGIVGLGTLVKNIKTAVKRRGYLIGLDGRHLFIRSDHAALNTLLQGGGAIVMKLALVLFHEKWGDSHGVDWAYCAQVHDEAQIEAKPEIADQIGKDYADAIRRAGELLGVRCPLAGSYDIGDNWAQTH
jgi:DNA polymerase-1